jgi:TetR/AcrR family transcriptional regulator, transcriptional repressor for nem operon
MAGRPPQYDEPTVLAKAAALFWAKGYEATSSEELLEAMGMGKGSLYHAFGSKRALFEKAMDHFSNPSTASLRKALQAGEPPLDVIRTFFRALAASPKEQQRNGCFMGNTLVGLSGIDPGLCAKAAGRLKDLEAVFLKALKDAKEGGQLRTKEDPGVLARYLVTLWNGLNITRRMYPDPAALRPMIELQLQLLY